MADLVYGRGTVYFFLVAIFLCAAAFRANKTTPTGVRTRAPWQKTVALFRFSAYRKFEVRAIRYRTPTIGVMVLLAAGFVFFTAMTLGPQPYYWPTGVAFGDSPPLATRSGWMALAATPFLILFASKANVIATLTGVSHEKLIVFHTWLAWAVLVLALLHTFPFIVYNYQQGMMAEMWDTSFSYWTGVAALLPQAYLTFMSVPWIRNRYYEFFKATHYLMALVFMVFFFIHCGFTLTSVDYFIVAGVLYALSWSYSQMKTYFDHGIRRRATLTTVSDCCLRVDIPVGPYTLWKPGQHMFLRFVTLGFHAFTAHPFTICSLPDGDKLVGEPNSVMTFYVKPRGGFTGRLAAAAAAKRNGGGDKDAVSVPVLLEGAYGGVHGRPLTGYERALVVACGSGAGFSLPFVMEWVAAAAGAATAAGGRGGGDKAPRRKMTVVIASCDTSVRDWYEAALAEFLGARDLEVPEGTLEVLIHLTSCDCDPATMTGASRSADDKTGPSLAVEKAEPSSPVANLGIRVLQGRPDLPKLVRSVTMENNASVGMAVCGPSAVLEAVRHEAAEAELRILKSGPGAREVYLYSEVFGW